MGFKLMHLTHRVSASTCKQLIGDEGGDFLMRAKMEKEKEKEKLTISQSDIVNEHVITDHRSGTNGRN